MSDPEDPIPPEGPEAPPAPDDGAPSEAAIGEAVTVVGATDDGVTGDGATGDSAADDSATDDSATDDSATDEAEPGQGAPADGAAGEGSAPAGRPSAFIRAGTEEWFVEARGPFEEKDVSGYVPSPESDKLRVSLDRFEGPLDLLLYLLDKHALDIFDIPIARITEEYLKILDDMRSLDLDVAGEFLVMASKLAHIKSRMLLPKEEREPEEEEEGDPRADLVRRLLEYQRFKDAAERLGELEWLGRDVFARPEVRPEEQVLDPDDPLGLGLAPIDVVELIALLDVILKRTKKKVVHEVFLERLNVSARINELVDFARVREHFTLEDVLSTFGGFARTNVIVSFLAVLEMAKLKLLRIHQPDVGGTIYLSPILENLVGDGVGEGVTIDYAGEESAEAGAEELV